MTSPSAVKNAHFSGRYRQGNMKSYLTSSQTLKYQFQLMLNSDQIDNFLSDETTYVNASTEKWSLQRITRHKFILYSIITYCWYSTLLHLQTSQSRVDKRHTTTNVAIEGWKTSHHLLTSILLRRRKPTSHGVAKCFVPISNCGNDVASHPLQSISQVWSNSIKFSLVRLTANNKIIMESRSQWHCLPELSSLCTKVDNPIA